MNIENNTNQSKNTSDSSKWDILIDQPNNNTTWDSLSEIDQEQNFFTRSDIVKITGASASKVRKEILKLKDSGEEFQTITTEKRQIVEALSREQFEMIRDSLLPLQNPPDNAITIHQFADSIHVYPDTIRKIAPSLGIALNKFKSTAEGKSGSALYITPEQQAEIQNYFDNKHGLDMPEEYIPISDIARELGSIRSESIYEFFEQKNEQLFTFRQKGINSRCISRERYDEIKEDIVEYLNSRTLGVGEAVQLPPNENFETIQQFADKLNVSINTIRDRLKICSSEVKTYLFKKNDGQFVRALYLSGEQQQEIIEDLEKSSQGVSKAEHTIGYYLRENGFNFKQSFRPDWMKNPNTGHNLEIDFFIDPPGIGIEYDGSFFHKDIRRDTLKDQVARQHGVNIIHIREFGCPEPADGMIYVDRAAKNDNANFSKSIESVLSMIGVDNPDVNIGRDEDKIFEYLRNIARKKAINRHPT